jgi:hypothetical protein
LKDKLLSPLEHLLLCPLEHLLQGLLQGELLHWLLGIIHWLLGELQRLLRGLHLGLYCHRYDRLLVYRSASNDLRMII